MCGKSRLHDFAVATVVTVVPTILMTEIGLLQRLLGMVELTLELRGACVLVGMALLVIAEVRKLWKIPIDEVPKVAE